MSPPEVQERTCGLIALPLVSGSGRVRRRQTMSPDTDLRTSLYSQGWPLPKDRAEVSGQL